MNFIGEYQIDRNVALGVAKLFGSISKLARPGESLNKGVDLSVKNSLDIGVSSLRDQPEIVAYFKEFEQSCLSKYKEEYEYSDKDKYYWGFAELGNIQYYAPGGGYYKYHCENSGSNPIVIRRHLAYMTYLCDIPIDEGGGTEFLYQNKIYECSLGRTLIWPAAWTHTHRGIPSHTREKMIITGWLSFLLD